MPDPMEHAEHRGWLEEVLRRIPGFRGYLEKEYRRESDRLQREWLVDRLQRSKRGLDAFARSLVDAGQVDALPQWERVRGKLDQLIGRIRGAMHGYSGVFDLVTVDEAVLDQVYEHDAALMNQVDELATMAENLDKDETGNVARSGDRPQPVDETPPADRASQLLDRAAQIARHWDERADILKGLD